MGEIQKHPSPILPTSPTAGGCCLPHTQRAAPGGCWHVRPPLQHWLSVPQTGGSISRNGSEGHLVVVASSVGLPGREEPYEARLNVSIQSGLFRAFDVPVFLFLSAAIVELREATKIAREMREDEYQQQTMVVYQLELLFMDITIFILTKVR